MWCLIVLIPDLCQLSYFEYEKSFITSGPGIMSRANSFFCNFSGINQKLRSRRILGFGKYQSIGPDKQNKNQRKIVIIFLSISLNMCFGCSNEPSHQEGSFEYPQHMFWLRN